MHGASRHLQIILSYSTGHCRNLQNPPRFDRSKLFADQVEVGNTINLVVIGNPGVAIAKAYLWTNVNFDPGAAI